jgi:hypothetical protein
VNHAPVRELNCTIDPQTIERTAHHNHVCAAHELAQAPLRRMFTGGYGKWVSLLSAFLHRIVAMALSVACLEGVNVSGAAPSCISWSYALISLVYGDSPSLYPPNACFSRRFPCQ